MVNLFDKIFSIECFTSEDDVLGFVSIDKIELLSSLHSSISSDDGFDGLDVGWCWKKNWLWWWNEKYRDGEYKFDWRWSGLVGNGGQFLVFFNRLIFYENF